MRGKACVVCVQETMRRVPCKWAGGILSSTGSSEEARRHPESTRPTVTTFLVLLLANFFKPGVGTGHFKVFRDKHDAMSQAPLNLNRGLCYHENQQDVISIYCVQNRGIYTIYRNGTIALR
jgi:hypothetical protein